MQYLTLLVFETFFEKNRWFFLYPHPSGQSICHRLDMFLHSVSYIIQFSFINMSVLYNCLIFLISSTVIETSSVSGYDLQATTDKVSLTLHDIFEYETSYECLSEIIFGTELKKA
jgi:hypothetical protein